MRPFKFGYLHRGYRKFHRVKFKHFKFGFSLFKPVLSDVFFVLGCRGWLEYSSVEAGRRVLRRLLRKQGHIFIKVFCFWPVTIKSAHSRMGSGKGDVCKYVYPLVGGKLLYEVTDFSVIKFSFRGWFFRRFCGILYQFLREHRWDVSLSRCWQYYCFFRVLDKFGFFPCFRRYLF